MTKRARYICIEGLEGTGKSTQTQLLVDYLRNKGFSVLQTKEPGTPLEPLTMTLRGIMLDNQYDAVLTKAAREYISQAIRSIHLERVIAPALNSYDFIVQDRGILSGYAYGAACGNTPSLLERLADYTILSGNTKELSRTHPDNLYNDVIILEGDIIKGMGRASLAKQEFSSGDAMESRDIDFYQTASDTMTYYSAMFNAKTISVEGKTIQEVQSELLRALNL
jgi:dTMP kinase